MSRNGSGTYTLAAGNPVVTATTIQSTWANNTLGDLASAMTASIANDGQTPILANLPMSSFKHTGVAAGAALTEYARYDQVQNGAPCWLSTVAGTDTITAAAPVAPSAYAAGQTFRFTSAGANTGATTLNISGLGAKSITKNGTTALAANDILSGAVVTVTYDGTQFQLDSMGLSTYAPLISPSFTTPNLGTPSAGVLTNCTGLPSASIVGIVAASTTAGACSGNSVTATDIQNFCAFTAHRSTNQTSGSTVIFDTVDNQVGGTNYSSSTGIFTAPTTGWYHFDACTSAQNTSGATITAGIELVATSTNPAASGFGLIASSSAQYSCGTTIYMTSGQTIKVNVVGGPFYASYYAIGVSYTSFSGSFLGA